MLKSLSRSGDIVLEIEQAKLFAPFSHSVLFKEKHVNLILTVCQSELFKEKKVKEELLGLSSEILIGRNYFIYVS